MAEPEILNGGALEPRLSHPTGEGVWGKEHAHFPDFFLFLLLLVTRSAQYCDEREAERAACRDQTICLNESLKRSTLNTRSGIAMTEVRSLNHGDESLRIWSGGH